MIRLREQYEQALQFRRRGFTYSEIANITGVSKGTIASWLAHEGFSKRVKDDNAARASKENSKRIKLLNKARSNQNERLYREAERSAALEYRHFKQSPLFVAGVTLYMSQGDVRDERMVRLSSSQKDVHRVFIKFAREYLGVPRETVKFWLLLYPTHNEATCVRAWSKALGLKKENYYKTQVVAGGSQKQTLQHGVGNTIIGSAVLKRKLRKWIELAMKEL